MAGDPAGAPYDVILIEGAIEHLPAAIVAQLAEGGRLISVEGTGLAGSARISVKHDGQVSGRSVCNVSARVLPGFERAVEFVF